MKLFSTSIFLIFVILREIECPLPIPKLPSIPSMDLSNVASTFSLWNKSASETGDTSTKGTGDEKESVTMKERFQNMLLSRLPQVSDELQLQFLVAIRALLGNSFPMAGWIITPLIDEVIAKYETKVPNSAALMTNPDTTDALIFKLMSQKVDDKNLNEFLEIGADSQMVKEVTSRFMKSLQLVADNYVDNYLRDIKEKVEKKLAE